MKCLVFLGFVALASAQVQIRLPFNNPAGITLTGQGYESTFQLPQFQPLQPRSAEQQQQQQEQAQAQQDANEQAQAQANADAQAQANANADAQAQANADAQAQAEQQQNQEQQVQLAARAANEYVPPQPVPYAAPAAAAYGYQQQVVAQPQYHAQVAQYHSAPALQYHHAYAAPAVAVHQKVGYAAVPAVAPAVAVHQKVGYAHTPVLTKVHGVADVPVTKLAYTQGITQKLVDVAQPAVTTRKVKVRRPALRKEFYDIEHRVIVRPAGSATLELSQPISKEQKGPTVLTPTKFVHHAPVVRYGASRQIVDGQGVPVPELQRSAQAPAAPRSAAPAAPAPAPESASPAPRAGPSASPAPRDADSEVVDSADQPAEPQQQQQPEQPQQAQEQPQQDQQQQQPAQPQEQTEQAAEQQQQQPEQAAPGQGRALTITPNMPAELQARLLELLSSRGGTVTEILNEDGKPADSASVLQVADALGDPSLQGGERITTRRIVVTRPIETIQEIEVQEPATKYSRIAVNQPTLFKTAIPAVARVPVAVPAVKHIATPVVKTTYAQPAFAYAHQPAYYHH